jgi:hypothetical protein
MPKPTRKERIEFYGLTLLFFLLIAGVFGYHLVLRHSDEVIWEASRVRLHSTVQVMPEFEEP